MKNRMNCLVVLVPIILASSQFAESKPKEMTQQEKIALAYVDSFNDMDWASIVKLMHDEYLAEFRFKIIDIIIHTKKSGQEELLQHYFDVTSLEDIEEMTPVKFFMTFQEKKYRSSREQFMANMENFNFTVESSRKIGSEKWEVSIKGTSNKDKQAEEIRTYTVKQQSDGKWRIFIDLRNKGLID